MDYKKEIKKLAKNFNLDDSKTELNYLFLSRREIVITNLLGRCPYFPYADYNLPLSEKAIKEFIQSRGFKKEIKCDQGRMISKKELSKELLIISKIKNKKLKEELETIYVKIKKGMKGEYLSLSSISKKGKHKEIILHEMIHELMDINELRVKDTNWNEGLVTFLTNYVLRSNGYSRYLEKIVKSLQGQHGWEQVYLNAFKWAKLLRNIKNPVERKKTIR